MVSVIASYRYYSFLIEVFFMNICRFSSGMGIRLTKYFKRFGQLVVQVDLRYLYGFKSHAYKRC